MGRAPCCAKVGLHRGPWTPKEDALLTKYIQAQGEGQWRSLPKRAGLLRCGKSCRLRWMNYLRPDIKRGNISPEEDDLIIRMHALLGNRWSLIAGRLPGRTDNEIKNYWNTHLSKRLKTPHRREKVKRKNNNNNNKKKSTKNNKKNKSNNNGDEEAEAEKKTNIYLPKPIRVRALSTSRNDSITTLTLDSDNGSSSASGDKDESPELLQKDMDVNYGIWDENGGFGFFVEEEHNIDLFNASISVEDNMECQSLEMLYEEYLQLLKNNNSDENQGELDYFAQSLFV